MTATRCTCGFAQRGDDTLADHLQLVFIPADSVASDGQVHEETNAATCSCGFAGYLDAHFLTVFTPADAIGNDGHEHQPSEATG